MKTRYTAVQQLRSARRLDDTAVDLTKVRRWFDGNGGGAQTTDADTSSDSNAGSGGAGGHDGGQSENPAWLPERLKRAQDKARQDERERLLKELGITDAEADRKLLAEARQRKQDEMSAVEKAAAEKAAAEKKAAELEAALNSERLAARLERRDNALKDALRTAGVVDDEKNPRTRRLLTLMKDERGAEVEGIQGEDGKLDEAKLKRLVTAAEADYPEYFKSGQRDVRGTGSHSGGRAVESDKAEKERAREEVRRRNTSGW